MTQTLLLVVLFVAVIATLPWLVRRLQQRQGRLVGASTSAPRMVSAIAVGPHQRVVTVEVGGEGERTTLVLGVTPQSIRCLHVQTARTSSATGQGSFSRELANAATVAPGPANATDRPMDEGARRAGD